MSRRKSTVQRTEPTPPRRKPTLPAQALTAVGQAEPTPRRRKRTLDVAERKLIGRRLRLVREAYQLTLAEVARRMSLPPRGGRSTVRQYEVGGVLPGLNYVETFALATGVSLEWLLCGQPSPVRGYVELPISRAALELLRGVWHFEFKEVRLRPPKPAGNDEPIGIIAVFERGEILFLVPSDEYRSAQSVAVILKLCAMGGRFGGGLYWPVEEIERVPQRDMHSWQLSYIKASPPLAPPIWERLCAAGQVDYSDAAARFAQLPQDVAGMLSRFKPGAGSPLIIPPLALMRWEAIQAAETKSKLGRLHSVMEKVTAAVEAAAALKPDNLTVAAPTVAYIQDLRDRMREYTPAQRKFLEAKLKRLGTLFEPPS